MVSSLPQTSIFFIITIRTSPRNPTSLPQKGQFPTDHASISIPLHRPSRIGAKPHRTSTNRTRSNRSLHGTFYAIIRHLLGPQRQSSRNGIIPVEAFDFTISLTTVLNSAHDALLTPGERPGVRLAIPRACGAEDIGHFKTRATPGCHNVA